MPHTTVKSPWSYHGSGSLEPLAILAARLQDLTVVGFTGIPLRTESSCDEPYMDHGRNFKADKESLLERKKR